MSAGFAWLLGWWCIGLVLIFGGGALVAVVWNIIEDFMIRREDRKEMERWRRFGNRSS